MITQHGLPMAIKKAIGLPTNIIVGVVINHHGDGTIDADIRGTTVLGLPALDSYEQPFIGDIINILSYGSTLLVIGKTATTGPDWQPYSPAWTGGTTAIGNGTITGSFDLQGATVIGEFTIVGGSTTNWGGGTGWSVSLPMTTQDGVNGTGNSIGTVVAGSGSTRYCGWLWQNGIQSVALAAEANTRWNATVPFTFVTGSEIRGKFIYERS